MPAVAAAPLMALAIGCASPSPPRPPSLNLPETVTDLAAERVADGVYLRWTTPSMTTDRIAVKGAMTAVVCRVIFSSSAGASACVPVARLPVQPGPAQTTDVLPPSLAADPPALLAYRVQILNLRGHSAGSSPQAFAAAGAAPPAVEQLRATNTRDGAMLEWKQQDTAAPVVLDRLLVGPNGVAIQPAPRKTPAKPSSKPTIRKQSTSAPKAASPSAAKPSQPKPPQITAPVPAEVKLRTPAGTDAGGTLDHTAQKTESYQYTAERVRYLSLGGHALELRSSLSPPVTVVMRDIFPPAAPSGLEAVPGGATATDRSIDLSWSPNTEDDLAGYFVYRQDIDSKGVATGTVTRLNTTPVVGPAYRDQTAMAGRRYAYRVTAVDAAGNESKLSDEVQETLREQ